MRNLAAVERPTLRLPFLCRRKSTVSELHLAQYTPVISLDFNRHLPLVKDPCFYQELSIITMALLLELPQELFNMIVTFSIGRRLS